MKLLSALIIAPALSFGALCDEPYGLKSVTQVIISGQDPSHLGMPAINSLQMDLSDLDLLHPALAYDFISGFQGGCGKQKSTVYSLARVANGDGFHTIGHDDYFLQLFDSTSHPNGLTYPFWFGFFRPADTLKGFLGRGGDGRFSNWYAAMMIVDSVRNAESGLWSKTTTLIAQHGPSDSLALAKSMLDPFRQVVYDANHKAYFKIQFLKVSYGSNASSAVSPRAQLRAAQSLRRFNLLGRARARQRGAALTFVGATAVNQP
jgi:hypothetical protein